MAGVFGFFDFTKPGKGVDPNAPPKSPISLFFALFWRNLSRLITYNMLYFALLTPLVSFFFSYFLGSLERLAPQLFAQGPNAPLYIGVIVPTLMGFFSALPGPLYIFLIALALFLYGPVRCGYAYVLRSFARQEHAWKSDFFIKAKENFAQGLFFGLLDAVVLFLFLLNISFVPQTGGPEALFLLASRYVSIFVFVVYLFMRYYIHLLSITFSLKIGQILKNAAIFAMVGLWRNLLILAVNTAVLLLLFFFPLAELIGVPLLLFSFTGFLSVFTVYPLIKKHMIDLPARRAAESILDS